jgi:hypothetical protein
MKLSIVKNQEFVGKKKLFIPIFASLNENNRLILPKKSKLTMAQMIDTVMFVEF